jgi:8-oxo-dGTP diphosphatase
MSVVIPCAGAIIRDSGGALLLIRRRNEPGAGLWSLPGGRVEPGESDEQAVVREVAEETGLRVTCGPLAGTADRPGPGGAVLRIRDYAAFVTGGELAAGDDAADARWVSAAEFAAMDAAGQLTGGLAAALRAWSVL